MIRDLDPAEFGGAGYGGMGYGGMGYGGASYGGPPPAPAQVIRGGGRAGSRPAPRVSSATGSAAANALDHDWRLRRILGERAGRAGRHALDLVDDVHAVGDATEHRVAPALTVLGLVIEERVVGDVERTTATSPSADRWFAPSRPSRACS